MSDNSSQRASDQPLSLLELFALFCRYRALVLKIVSASIILSAIVAFLIPNTYVASARLLPPQSPTSAGAILSAQLSQFPVLSGFTAQFQTQASIYVGALRSRSIAERLAKQFDLAEVYGEKTFVDTLRTLEDLTNITLTKENLIVIEVEDREPQRAAALANAYVDELFALTRTLTFNAASHRRRFYEEQLAAARRDLANAEMALKGTQEQTGVVVLDEQSKASIEAAVLLQARISAKEIELAGLRSFATPANADYVRATQELAAMRRELAKIEKGTVKLAGGSIVSIDAIPTTGLEYFRKLRDVKYFEKVTELLAGQVEAARIDESYQAAPLQVLDRAQIPDRKSGPKRALIIMISAIGSLFLGLFAAVFVEHFRRAETDPVLAPAAAEVKRTFFFWRREKL